MNFSDEDLCSAAKVTTCSDEDPDIAEMALECSDKDPCNAAKVTLRSDKDPPNAEMAPEYSDKDTVHAAKDTFDSDEDPASAEMAQSCSDMDLDHAAKALFDSDMDTENAAKVSHCSDKDTKHAAKALSDSDMDPTTSKEDNMQTDSSIVAIDFGTGDALAIHGPDGPISKRELALPRVPGGRTPSHEFPMILEALFERGHDVVVESPTVGSSGAEPRDVKAIMRSYPRQRLYTLSARAVKNYRMDYDLPNPKSYAKYETISEETQVEAHKLDAEILWMIATETPRRLRVWHQAEPCPRIHISVRPMDKRGYRYHRADAFIALLPAPGLLPAELRSVVLDPKGNYARSLVMPFAMALTEPYWREAAEDEQRRKFLKILGAYDHGYPSFYRRMTIVWMQQVAKRLAGVTRMQEVPRDVRKQALRITQRQLRMMFHLSKNVSDDLISAALLA